MNTTLSTAATAFNGKRPRPVLMIPLRRCGSHALRLRLNFNHDFYSPYPLHIVDFMPLLPLYGDLADDKAYFRLVVDVVGLQAASVVKWPGVVFDPVDIFESIRHEPRSIHRIVWEMLLRAGEVHGAKLVMDKSLDSVHYADELMRLFPDMLFLNVLRDPRAQVSSMNRAIIHDFDATLNALEWLRAYKAGSAVAERYPQRTLTIRYEDFVFHQEETLRKVCAFFGMDYLPEMLDVSRSQEAQQISQLSALWSSNCFPPIPANTDKFKSQLSMDDIEMIETITQDFMREYGYGFMTAAQARLPDEAMLREAKTRSEANRLRAWSELEQNNPRDFILRRFRSEYLARVRSTLESNVRQPAAHAATV